MALVTGPEEDAAAVAEITINQATSFCLNSSYVNCYELDEPSRRQPCRKGITLHKSLPLFVVSSRSLTLPSRRGLKSTNQGLPLAGPFLFIGREKTKSQQVISYSFVKVETHASTAIPLRCEFWKLGRPLSKLNYFR
jgi:hypothetical protein